MFFKMQITINERCVEPIQSDAEYAIALREYMDILRRLYSSVARTVFSIL